MSPRTLVNAESLLQFAAIPNTLGGAGAGAEAGAEADARPSPVLGRPFVARQPAACLP